MRAVCSCVVSASVWGRVPPIQDCKGLKFKLELQLGISMFIRFEKKRFVKVVKPFKDFPEHVHTYDLELMCDLERMNDNDDYETDFETDFENSFQKNSCSTDQHDELASRLGFRI